MVSVAEIAYANRLVRLRADPAKIRIRLRYWPDQALWWCFIQDAKTTVEGHNAIAEYAVRDAYERAELAELDGIDAGMGHTYLHPWRP